MKLSVRVVTVTDHGPYHRDLSVEDMRIELAEQSEELKAFDALVERVTRYRNGECYRTWLLDGRVAHEAWVTVKEVSQ